MRINTNKQHRDVHTATVDHDVALRIIAERAAEELGVCLEHEGVSWRGYYSTRDTSHGIFTDVVIEIINDHMDKPGAAK